MPSGRSTTLATGGEPTSAHPPGFRLRRGRNWFFLGLTYASYYLCRYNLGPVAPELMRDLGLKPSEYGLIRTFRDGAYAIGQMVNGLFTDRLGGKKAMTIGAVATILLNLAFGWAAWSNLGPLLLSVLVSIRMADGYFQAFGAPGFIKINTAWFRRKERGAFAGIFGAMINLGAAGAPQLAKLLATGFVIPLGVFTLACPQLDWRYVFMIPPIFVAVVILLMNIFVKNTPEEAGFRVEHDEEQGETSTERVRLRDVWRKIASNRIVWIVAAAYFCTGFVRSAIEGWWAKYLEDIWNAGKASGPYDALSWGLPITATLGSLCSGLVSDRFFGGRRAPVAATLYFSQLCFTLIALAIPHDGSVQGPWLAVIAVIGIAMLCNSTHSILGTAAAMDLGGTKMAGCASGIIDSFQYYGGMFSGFGLGVLFEATYRSAASQPTTTGSAEAGHIPIDPTVWFGSMVPFGIMGTVLMGYLWLRHHGTDTRGT